MPRKLIPPESWWAEAADLMARSEISLRQAAAELGINLTIEDAENIKDRKLFQKVLEDAKIAYFTAIGSSPKLSKDLVVGQVYKLAEKLALEGEAYKASDALLKLAKIKGWLGQEPDSLYNLFRGLSQKDIDEVKRQILKTQAGPDKTADDGPKTVAPQSLN